MAKLFVFGIGGTGARVMKSLTMLMATGVEIPFDIVPILIDPDGSGGDLNRTIELLRNYQTIQKSIEGYDKNDFFVNKIRTLGEIISEKGSNVAAFHGFRYELDGVQNDTFKDFIGLSSMDQHNAQLTRMLFSDANLEADLRVGFKGNPNMGSVVLNQFTKSEFFQSFADTCTKDDRIFIISSIFGGTGAAGFPLLLKNIRKGKVLRNNYDHLRNARIGAITVLPYFNLKQNESSEIDSHGFITKTKAALTYYAKNITGNQSINALYYIGDQAENVYDNNEGGVTQKNDAHFIELASALAVIDFAQTEDQYLETIQGRAVKPMYKEFGIKNTEQITFEHLYASTDHLLKKKLTRYFYFNLFLKEKFQEWLHAPFATTNENKFDENYLHQTFYKTVNTFNQSFRIWLGELDRNQISFSPFSFTPIADESNAVVDYSIGTTNIFTLVKDVPEKKNKFNPLAKNNYELFVHHLNKASDEVGGAPDTNKRLMAVFSKGTEALLSKKLF